MTPKIAGRENAHCAAYLEQIETKHRDGCRRLAHAEVNKKYKRKGVALKAPAMEIENETAATC